MRNYIRFWLTVIAYDDGTGNVFPLSVWFESRAQRDEFFSAFPTPPAFIVQTNYDAHIWMLLNKSIMTVHLNSAYGASNYTPVGLPIDSTFSPYGQWGLKNEAFVRADQDPIK